MTEKDGIPQMRKLQPLKGAPSPKNVAELRSYLGLLNYYGNFIPNLSTLLQPLHELLRKGVKWAWTEECEKEFVRSKSELVADKVLVPYDEKKKQTLACDASPYGVGAVISHVMDDGEEHPIAFASRTLTKSERNYSQIEKEALGIVFGFRKFHKYLYGRTFHLLTDHKALATILGPKTAVPTLAAARMQRWAVILQAYNYQVQYRSSAEHANAEAGRKEEERKRQKSSSSQVLMNCQLTLRTSAGTLGEILCYREFWSTPSLDGLIM